MLRPLEYPVRAQAVMEPEIGEREEGEDGEDGERGREGREEMAAYAG